MPDPNDDAHEARVRAAGGVVWRRTDTVEVLLVHRPRYDDWSMPKGKLDDGESFEDAAVREVEEETGIRAALGEALGEVRYVDHKGRDKVVRWWAMEADRERNGDTDVTELQPMDPDEVDQLRWVSLADADALLTYPLDVEVMGRFRATVEPR
ncbi:NUDIX hydrolase [Euzebya pacifica]|uniref:NUDIX hydrolase n=1 Tax=Euzebya pacifica TaxID=1608957 RepID=UPI0030F7314B